MKIPKNINFWEKGFVFGEINHIFGKDVFSINQGGMSMVKKGYKGRCEKQRIEKCMESCISIVGENIRSIRLRDEKRVSIYVCLAINIL